jgi:hypothetical protein
MSSVRLRIVINSPNGTSTLEQTLTVWFAMAIRLSMRTLDELARMWDELVVLLRQVWGEMSARLRPARAGQARLGQGRIRQGLAGFSQIIRQSSCAMTGHDDQMRADGHHLALACGKCGRVTSGWELPASSRSYASPSRHHAIAAGPRYFTAARRDL